MTSSKKSVLSIAAVSAVSLLMLSGCAIPKFEDADAEVEIPERTLEFRVHEIRDDLNVLLAAEGDKDADIDLIGEVGRVGNCLGVTDTDEGNLMVVWPADTLVLNKKVGIEFRSKDGESSTRTRLGDKSPVVLSGSFVKEASWISEIPETCEIPEQGVFVVQNASHPAPKAEEEK